MVKCPHCKGEKVIKWLTSREWEEKKLHAEACEVCGGSGEVAEITAAIYKARGGPEPTPLRGYA